MATEGSGGAMATAVRGKEAYQAVMASKVVAVGRCKHGGVAVVTEERRGQAGTGDDDDGGRAVLRLLLRQRRRPRQSKWRAWGSAGGCWE